MSDEDRTTLRRENNRKAAERCRQKKLTTIEDLRNKVNEFEKRNASLNKRLVDANLIINKMQMALSVLGVPRDKIQELSYIPHIQELYYNDNVGTSSNLNSFSRDMIACSGNIDNIKIHHQPPTPLDQYRYNNNRSSSNSYDSNSICTPSFPANDLTTILSTQVQNNGYINHNICSTSTFNQVNNSNNNVNISSHQNTNTSSSNNTLFASNFPQTFGSTPNTSNAYLNGLNSCQSGRSNHNYHSL